MKIGVLVPRSGPAGLWGPPSEFGAVLAAAELNCNGGILGQSVDLTIADAGWTEREAAEAAFGLVEIDGVDAVVGMHPSNTRPTIANALSGKVPYIYAAQYEGGEDRRTTIAIGGLDRDLLLPSIPWLMEHKRAKRFFLVGNDYNWPRISLPNCRTIIQAAGGDVVGCAIVPWSMQDRQALFDRIVGAGADVVVTFLVGLEAVAFNRAFAEAGLSRHILRLELAVDEPILYATGADNAENLYVCLHYIMSAQSREAERFLELYHEGFESGAPPASSSGQSCYEGVHALAGLARSAQSFDLARMKQRLGERFEYRTTRSFLKDGANGRQHPVHLAVADGLDLKLIHSY